MKFININESILKPQIMKKKKKVYSAYLKARIEYEGTLRIFSTVPEPSSSPDFPVPILVSG